ncbi:MAG: TonB family protein [Terracidiphilus sp.]|jgi:protein TonB
MDMVLGSGERLERELTPEPMAGPAMGSLLLHGALAVCLLTYGMLAGFFHHKDWGDNGTGGAIQVTLVTSALPLPSDQPPNQNVLSTETPSQAPAEVTPKAKQAVDESALEIAGKQKKPDQQTARRTPPRQTTPQPENTAQYGEQAGSSMARSMAPQGFTSGQTTVSDSNFGNLFSYYVRGINTRMGSGFYKQEVDQHTPRGARAYIEFTIHRDGSLSNIKLDQSSGSTTLDRACQLAAQRVDSFGPLPSQYNQSTVMTSYYCEY